MAFVQKGLPVWEDRRLLERDELAPIGEDNLKPTFVSEGKCPYCRCNIFIEKSLDKPTTPGASVRYIGHCISKYCGKDLTIRDGNEGVLSREDELQI